MRATSTLVILILPLVFTSVSAIEADREAPGIVIGQKVPAFKLNDQSGKSTDLNSLLKKGRMLAIVFHRSADW